MNKKDKAIEKLLVKKIKSAEELMAVKRKLAKKHGISVLRNSDILEYIKKFPLPLPPSAGLKGVVRILRKRAVRTLSGIAPVAVLVKPFKCPGKCIYCPTEKGVPQSYLSNEPAVMRAIHCDYDPYLQVQYRLRALEANGHEPTKIELIVIGGTWSTLPEKYKYWYILNCFTAANDYGRYKNQTITKSKAKNFQFLIFNFQSISKFSISKLKKKLLIEQKKNEKAKYKIIGITLETRPDYINEKELWQMRELGATRVELGVQAIDDKILKLNKRGHGIDEIARATRLLKDFGFKITYHIMPGLPGSTPAKDLKMFKQLFSDERFQPDQLKFYPTVVTRGSLLYKWWKAGKYKPYSAKQLEKLIADCKAVVPEYVRIVRLIRDIPEESIIAGNRVTNLRQIMQQRGAECRCIRCREARERKFKVKSLKLKVIKYEAAGGEEYFLQYTVKGGNTLYGFCRLRIPDLSLRGGAERRRSNLGGRDLLRLPRSDSASELAMTLKNYVLIRELHVYGELVPVGKGKKIQHAGLGRKLMAEAEKIAAANGFKKIAVIAGVGARGYYRKLGYGQKNTYMIKRI